MARPHKPYQFQGHWTSKIKGQRVSLGRVGPDDGLIPPPAVWAKLGELLVEAQSGQLSDEILVKDLVAQYLLRPRGSATTKQKNRDQLVKFLSLFGERKVSSLRIADADTWHAAVANLAGSTYNGMLRTVRAVVNFALERELFKGKNPFRTLKLRPETPRTRTITPDEFSALVALADQDQRELLYCLRYAISRPQDWEADWSGWQGPILNIGQHKTAWAMGAKIIDLPPQVRDILSARMCRRGNQGPIFPGAAKSHLWFAKLVKAAGIADETTHPSGERLTPYCLRHTCATDIADRGATTRQLMVLGSWLRKLFKITWTFSS